MGLNGTQWERMDESNHHARLYPFDIKLASLCHLIADLL